MIIRDLDDNSIDDDCGISDTKRDDKHDNNDDDGSGGHAFTLQAVVLLTAVPDCSIQSQTTTVEVLMIVMWMMTNMVIVTIKK